MTSVTESKGLKRDIVSLLNCVGAIFLTIPGVSELITAIQILSGALGGVAIAHAASAKTLSKRKIGTITSALSALLLILKAIPAIEPYVSVIETVIIGTSAANVGLMIDRNT